MGFIYYVWTQLMWIKCNIEYTGTTQSNKVICTDELILICQSQIFESNLLGIQWAPYVPT